MNKPRRRSKESFKKKNLRPSRHYRMDMKPPSKFMQWLTDLWDKITTPNL